MTNLKFRRFLAITLVAAGLLLAWVWLSRPTRPVEASNTITLRAPSSPSASFLADEAGITAYAYMSHTIRLDYVKSVFRTIEAQTEDYLIGSVPVPNYPIEYDAHVYVHRDGWVAAYYINTDPVSRVFDWRHYRITPTNLETVLSIVVDKDGLTLPLVSYYDFRYPNATHVMFIAKQTGTYQINLPSSFTFSERSWVLGAYQYGGGGTDLILDDVTLADLGGTGWKYAIGDLSEGQLLPDLMHTFEIKASYATGFNGLALTYRDPNANH